MNHHLFKTALLALSLTAGAQAASFERQTYQAVGGYSASTGTAQLAADLLDLSPAEGELALFGAGSYGSALGAGQLAHAYAADAFVSFGSGAAELALSLSHSLDVTGAAQGSHQQALSVELSALRLKIVADAGEVQGQALRVSFAGLASSLFEIAESGSGYLGLGLSVQRGDTVLGEYLWDARPGSEQQAVQLAFDAQIGEEIVVSSYLLSGAGFEAANFPMDASMLNMAAELRGSFAITPVPEPESYALLLSGLAVLAWARRRRG